MLTPKNSLFAAIVQDIYCFLGVFMKIFQFNYLRDSKQTERTSYYFIQREENMPTT